MRLRTIALLSGCCCIAACARHAVGSDPGPAAAPSPPPSAADTGFPAHAVDSIVRAALRERAIPAASVAVIRRGELAFVRAYGTADREAGTPASAETVYGIGSISKLVTATAVMRLVEGGRVRLDAPIAAWLPNHLTHGHPVLVRHLLQHTSGIPDFVLLPGFGEMEQGKPEAYPRDRLVELFGRQPLSFAPGQRWAYSNSNYTLLGLIIEAETGQVYADYIEEALMRPLGLVNTFSCETRPDDGRLARGYFVHDGGIVSAPFFNPATAIGDGGLCATAVDLARWMHALGAGRAISSTSWTRMTTPTPLESGFRPEYGFGVNLATFDGRRRFGHSGHAPGYTGTLGLYPDDDLVVAVLTNQGAAWPESIEKAIVRRVLDLRAPAPRNLLLSPEGRARYAGIYDTGNFPLSVTDEGGELRVELKGPVSLRYQGEHTFVGSADPDAVRLVFAVEHGRAERVTLEFAGMRWYGVRMSAPR